MCCTVIRLCGGGKLFWKHILLWGGRLEANLLQINCNSNGYALSPSTSLWFRVLNCKRVRRRRGGNSGKLRGKYKKKNEQVRGLAAWKCRCLGWMILCWTIPKSRAVFNQAETRAAGLRARVPLSATFRPSVLDGQQTDFVNKAIVRNHWTGEYCVGSCYRTLGSRGATHSLFRTWCPHLTQPCLFLWSYILLSHGWTNWMRRVMNVT